METKPGSVERAFKRLKVNGQRKYRSDKNSSSTITTNPIVAKINTRKDPKEVYEGKCSHHPESRFTNKIEPSSANPSATNISVFSSTLTSHESTRLFKSNDTQSDKEKLTSGQNQCIRRSQTCAQNAREEGDISVDELSVVELAAYFEEHVNIPKKMSFMAEMMYT